MRERRVCLVTLSQERLEQITRDVGRSFVYDDDRDKDSWVWSDDYLDYIENRHPLAVGKWEFGQVMLGFHVCDFCGEEVDHPGFCPPCGRAFSPREIGYEGRDLIQPADTF